jgi:glycine/D-amino acid oxidase-like deaminating enzyme
MRKVFIKKGGNFVQGCKVDGISRQGDHYHLATPLGNIEAQKLVMAAGLGNILLFSKLGKTIPLVPQKGQLLVTERIKPFLSFPFSGIRQTGCGSVMIGYTNENTGFDTETTVPAAMQLAKRAVTIFPALRHARVVRSWASLRILTGDGLPIYDHVEGYPGCYILDSTQLYYPRSIACITPGAMDSGCRKAGRNRRFQLREVQWHC